MKFKLKKIFNDYRVLTGLLMLLMLLLLGNSKTDDSYSVIVHMDNPTEVINRKTLSKIFLKKRSKWEYAGGIKIMPVDIIVRKPVRTTFTNEIHHKRIAAIKAYWQRQIFTGRGVPPPELQNDLQVLEYVQKNPGAIGYISKAIPLGDYKVKKIRVEGIER